MAIPHYLAMTASEIASCPLLPPKIGWMACHFSPYGTGLSNCPYSLPPGSLLILNDRTPIHLHDPLRIAKQLTQISQEFSCDGVLLDFQRPGSDETRRLCAFLVDTLSLPVVVSSLYAQGIDSPVFLPSPPCHIPLNHYIAPWKGREIWLELALESQELVLTPQGCESRPFPWQAVYDTPFRDDRLHCRYRSQVSATQARFTLRRTREELEELTAEAGQLGITATVALYQQLRER